jgi:predicted phosphodiesterase
MSRSKAYVFLVLCFVCSFAVDAGASFLLSSDIHYGVNSPAKDGKDTGPLFLATAMTKLSQLSKSVDFILNLGDLPQHSVFSVTKKGGYERVVFQELYTADQYKKPMFYIPGNNDSLIGNYQPFERDGLSPLSYATDWDGACLYCGPLIIDTARMAHGGYYSSYVIPDNKDIILIAMNSAPFVNTSPFIPRYPNKERDAEEQLVWFEQQLKKHTAKQLLIAFHVPPGANALGGEFWQKKQLERFTTILDVYSKSYGQITLLTGHTHMDELRKITLKNGTTVYDYSTPSISRNHHNNPGLKVIQLNQQMQVSNYTTYYTTFHNEWRDEHYSAMGGTEAIFSKCHTQNLSTCLDSLSDSDVCHYLEQGLFYSSKSDRVPQSVCRLTYRIISLQ